MTRRRPKPEELDLWHQVARTAIPLRQNTSHYIDRSEPEQLAKPLTVEPLSPFSMGQANQSQPRPHVLPMTSSEQIGQAPVQMDAKSFARMKRGKLVPESRIDLHGMSVDRAHGALNQFILSSRARGLRLVLVITGKGQREDPYDPAPRRRGVLKSQVPLWLRMAPLSGAVLQVTEAHRKHGGEGALYVYLRRDR